MDNPPPGVPCYPLANPKGIEHLCEICSKPALLQCALCRSTYYCGVDHQRLDWTGIHDKLCNSLKELRQAAPFVTSETERRKKKEAIHRKNIELVGLTTLMSQKFLFQNKYEEAVPAALQCLKITIDAYGMASAELVVPYLLLAEASIGVGRLCQAESYLAQAQWTLSKMQHQGSHAIRSQVQRKLGLLYTVKGEYENALESLAKDIFFASCEFGTDHIRTAGGYFQLGQVFYALAKQASKSMTSSGLKSPTAAVENDEEGTAALNDDQQSISSSSSCHEALDALECRLANEVPHQFRSLSSALASLSTGSDRQGPHRQVDACKLPSPPDKAIVADSLVTRVVDIWSNYLADILVQLHDRRKQQQKLRKTCKNAVVVNPHGIESLVAELAKTSRPVLDDAQKAEVENTLKAVEQYRIKRMLDDQVETVGRALDVPDPKVRLQFALSMLSLLLDRKSKALYYFTQGKTSLSDVQEPHPRLIFERDLLEETLEVKPLAECVKVAV